MLPPGLLVVHDTRRSGEDHLAKRAGGEQEGAPVLDRVDGNVEAGRDDAALVQAAVQLDDNLAAAVVVDNLEFANVACRCISTRFLPYHAKNRLAVQCGQAAMDGVGLMNTGYSRHTRPKIHRELEKMFSPNQPALYRPRPRGLRASRFGIGHERGGIVMKSFVF